MPRWRLAAKGPSDLARWGAWLVLAADLTLLRSQLLVPSTPEGAQDAQERAEGLRRQVMHRAEAAGLADWLERREQLGREVWGRGHPEARGAGARVGDVTALFRACLPALRVPVAVEGAFRIAGRSGLVRGRRARADPGHAAGGGGERRAAGPLPARRVGRCARLRAAMPGGGGEHLLCRVGDGAVRGGHRHRRKQPLRGAVGFEVMFGP